MTYVDKDVQRVLDLPRVVYPPELAERLSEAWRAPGGSWVLREDQAKFLYSLGRFRGAVGGLSVGMGKSLCAMLAPLALGVPSEDVLVILPASLIGEAESERPGYLEQFALPPAPRYLSYAMLARPDNVNILDEIAPKVIVVDEAHALRNSKSARTRRLTRYLRRNPDTVFVPMSGTLAGETLFDYAHLLRWAMGAGAAIPKPRRILEAWSRVLDVGAEEPPTGYDYKLLEPLLAWAKTTDHRAALYERLRTAPGMVLSTESSCDTPISIQRWKPSVPKPVSAALDRLEEAWVLPDGTEVLDQLRLAVAKKQVSLGYYMRWTWPVAGSIDREWLKVRSDYYREIRGVTNRGKEGYETQGLVERALRAGRDPYLPVELYEAAAAWEQIEDRADPVPEAVWFDDSVVRAARDEAEASGEPTIIWYTYVCVGKALEALGVPTSYAGDPVPCARVVALSVRAHGTGLNLQRFTSNLVLEAPGNAGTWEQMLGRTHRGGQALPVACTVLAHTPALSGAVSKARTRAKYVEETTGIKQKLNLATWS